MERVALGEEILVTRHGKPSIRLLPAADGLRGRRARAADPAHRIRGDDQQAADGHQYDLLDRARVPGDADHDPEQQEEDQELERDADQPQHHHRS
jgi:antitoxin (DNA-binding transcriptional repressor) of toxin-antitoxin stability system